MTTFVLCADRGQTMSLAAAGMGTGLRSLAVARSATMQLQVPWCSVWLQLRGNARVDAREGRFELAAGDWIALDQGAHPLLQAGRGALLLGIALPPELQREMQHARDCLLYPGRGSIACGERLIALRLWRNLARRESVHTWSGAAPERLHLDAFLHHLAQAHPDLLRQLDRCPGKTRRRKQQVFARLQRAKLYLEGHADRIVSLTELAQLTSFSNWYLSKTFQAAYGETLQAASRRIRMARACQLLERTGLTVEEVAVSCGFGSPSSFARAFRAETGVTSTRYRSVRRHGNEARASRAACMLRGHGPSLRQPGRTPPQPDREIVRPHREHEFLRDGPAAGTIEFEIAAQHRDHRLDFQQR